MQYLPTKITGFRSTVINAIIDYIDSLKPIRSDGLKHRWTPHGIAYEVNPSYSDDSSVGWLFDVSVSGTQITVEKGFYFIQGVKRVDYAGTGVTPATATGEYCYPTMQLPINDIDNPVLIVPTAIPPPDATNIYTPLVRLKCLNWDTAKDQYALDDEDETDPWIYHKGMIPLTNPIVFSQA